MSGMTEHPERLLSAYLDDALAPDERASVRAHLESCARCASRLDDLRATSRLIAALPPLAPARSLRPPVQQGWLWLRPVRLLGSIGTGAFLFLFLASYVVNSGSNLGGGTTTSEQLAAKGQFGAAASAAAAENAQRAAARTPVAAAAPAAASTGTTAQDSARGATAPPAGAQLAVATGTATAAREDRPPFGPPSAAFLALALLFAFGTFAAHRGLRRR
jgi:anti-sigma factor RsiW